MLSILAQQESTTPVRDLFESVIGMFSSGAPLAQPDVLVENLKSLSTVWAAVFIIVGLLCLFNGYKFYKTTTIMLALLMGLFAGYWLGKKIEAPFIVGGCLGLLLATVAYPLMKYAVAIFGGLAGAFIGGNLWAGFAHALNKGAQMNVPVDAYWVGALIGLIVCGMLAFILFKLSVVLFTSVSGSTIAVLGVLALLLSIPQLTDTVSDGLTANQLVVPLLVFVPAIIGLIMQEFWTKGDEAPSEA
ncbi:DUF4203 domain-containing protein [Planctomycetota bacterium]|nr:DUF4203 domain-containing protein [Planctomycetota bacterium]